MYLTALLAVSLIPWAASALQPVQQQPITERDRLSDVISASRFLSFHRELCEIESISDHEKNVGKYLQTFLEGHDFIVTAQQVPHSDGSKNPPRWNIYAVPDPEKYKSHEDNDESMDTNRGKKKHHKHRPAKPKVLLTSHIDTVPPFIPYSLSSPHSTTSKKFNRSSILISGRGTVDAKACVAAQITAAMELLLDQETSFNPTDLALLFVVSEERYGTGMLHFSDSKLYHSTNSAYKAIIFGEPTELKLAAGHKGIFSLQLTAHGKAAHSGYPWLGRNAISSMLPTLTALDTLSSIPPELGGLPRSERFGNTTLNIGFVRGGVASNVIPESMFADVAIRLAGRSVPELVDVLHASINRTDPNGLLDVKHGVSYPPVSLDTDVEGFESIVVNYGTDIPNLNVRKGVKRYLYGPGSILVAHGADEGLTVGDLEESVEGYKRLVRHALTL